MLKFVKRSIKKWPFLYHISLYLVRLIQAVRNVTLNFDSIREFNSLRRGSIDLAPGNFKFYTNLFPHLINKIEVDASSVVILDVGANDGWFAKVVYRFAGENTSVISFEPLRSMIPKLKMLAEKYSFYQYENIALGAANEIIEITEYNTTGLSSLKGLSTSYEYSHQHYDTSIANKYPVNVATIDWYLADRKITSPLILKIDTQGFEYEVLKGAEQALLKGQIKVVIVEVMTVEKYSGGVLYDRIFESLHSYGFTLFDLHPSYYESDGTLSEFDCAFIKR